MHVYRLHTWFDPFLIKQNLLLQSVALWPVPAWVWRDVLLFIYFFLYSMRCQVWCVLRHTSTRLHSHHDRKPLAVDMEGAMAQGVAFEAPNTAWTASVNAHKSLVSIHCACKLLDAVHCRTTSQKS